MGFLDTQLQETYKEAAAVAQDLRRNNHDRAMRVATWMLVGNGVALLACFNAAISRDLCDWQVIQPYAGAFLFGLVSAAAHVIFDGEADSRGSARLTLMMGATRRASLCIDSNNALRAWVQESGASPQVEVQRQIDENDAAIAEAKSVLAMKGDEPCDEKALRGAANVALGLSALSLGATLLVAINFGAVEAALCPQP